MPYNIDKAKPVYLIAELGVSHEGDVTVAENIIKQLEGSGVAAIKLQSFTPERYISASEPERLERLRSFSLDMDAHKYLKQKAFESGLQFISTPLSEDWVEPLAQICDKLKIASGDIDFAPTITAAAATGLPVIISTGTANVEEIDNAIKLFKSAKCDQKNKSDLSLMHCISEYPADIKDCNLLSIPFLHKRYGIEVGWSNHVIGPLACCAAVALGAKMVEVHVTDRKEGRSFRDHALSFEPREIPILISDLNLIKASLGAFGKRATPAEEKNIRAMRKGLIFSADLKSGTIISEDDILYARPATHFSSYEKNSIVGRKLAKDVKSGHLVSEDSLF